MKMLPRLKPTASGSIVVPTKIREHDHKIEHVGAKRDRGCGLVLQTLTGLKILWKGQTLDKMLPEVTKVVESQVKALLAEPSIDGGI